MKFVFSSLIVLAVAFFAATQEARACDCVGDPLIDGKPTPVDQKVEKAFEGASAVFLGRVLSVKKIKRGRELLVTFEVENVWKNKIGRRVTISTDSEDFRCGYGFVAGKKYLVYTFGDKDFWTNNCTRTRLIADAGEDVEILDRIKKKSVR